MTRDILRKIMARIKFLSKKSRLTEMKSMMRSLEEAKVKIPRDDGDSMASGQL